MGSSKAITNHSSAFSWKLSILLVFAFVLRFWGVWFGLPDLYHADEPIVVNHALAYGTGDLNPHFFNIPPLVSYLLFVCYGIFYLVGRGVGIFHSLSDFENLFYADPTLFYLIARLLFGVFIGTATVYLLYRLVRRFWDRRTAFWAAFFLAVNFLHARDSHYVYVDIPLLFTMLAGMFVFFQLMMKPLSLRLHALAGAMIGLAVAVKYNGAFLALPYLWICLKKISWKKWAPAWLLAAGCAICAFILLNPFAILDWRFFIKELAEQSAANIGGLPWIHHLRYSLLGAMGWPFLLFALIAWGRALFSKNVPTQALAVFVLGYYLVLCKWGQPYDRYVLPLVPFLCILAADLLAVIVSKFPKMKLLFSGLLILAVLPPALKIVQWDRIMGAKDARTIAKEWIEKNVPAGSRVALDWEFYMPRLEFSRAQLLEKAAERELSEGQRRKLEAMLAQSQQPSYDIFFMVPDTNAPRFLFARPVVPFDLNSIKSHGIEYVLVAEGIRSANDVFLKELEKNGELIVRFTPFKDSARDVLLDTRPLTGGPFLWQDIVKRQRNGYPVRIYKLK